MRETIGSLTLGHCSGHFLVLSALIAVAETTNPHAHSDAYQKPMHRVLLAYDELSSDDVSQRNSLSFDEKQFFLKLRPRSHSKERRW
ncbi:hypothetical protein OUZ56_026743 [Daphnia magna]|uniref:Uncharacterized protein n=1 Tax=Daphnia magna TaxID=35525 RepID=A0ABQ9ZMT4_9CRUS|nr:hypothetical protein OUZ56_026743 [Daphnia magna]